MITNPLTTWQNDLNIYCRAALAFVLVGMAKRAEGYTDLIFE